LLIRHLLLRDLKWIGDTSLEEALKDKVRVYVRVRSTRPPQPAWLIAAENGAVRVVLDDGEEGVAPGQACVFYENLQSPTRVLGGGWIKSTSRDSAALDMFAAGTGDKPEARVGETVGH
jgi:tRNA-specific 2-thiouridylase